MMLTKDTPGRAAVSLRNTLHMKKTGKLPPEYYDAHGHHVDGVYEQQILEEQRKMAGNLATPLPAAGGSKPPSVPIVATAAAGGQQTPELVGRAPRACSPQKHPNITDAEWSQYATGKLSDKEIQQRSAARTGGIKQTAIATAPAAAAIPTAKAPSLPKTFNGEIVGRERWNADCKINRGPTLATKTPKRAETGISGREFASRLNVNYSSFVGGIGTGMYPQPDGKDSKGNMRFSPALVEATVTKMK